VIAMAPIWVGVRRVAASLALGLVLFIDIWVCRVFFAGPILGPLMPLSVLWAIAWIAIIAGAIPALPLGFGYGLMQHRNVLVGAVVVALIGCLLELATSAARVSWWKFITWWVLPLECITVLAVFVIAALVGSRSLRRVLPPVRSRLGVGIFVLFTALALSWPWLYSCIALNVCKLVP
jgi:hypothetical protein